MTSETRLTGSIIPVMIVHPGGREDIDWTLKKKGATESGTEGVTGSRGYMGTYFKGQERFNQNLQKKVYMLEKELAEKTAQLEWTKKRLEENTPNGDSDEFDQGYAEILKSIEEISDGPRRHAMFSRLSKQHARYSAAELVRNALVDAGSPTLQSIQDKVGIERSLVSRIANGSRESGPNLHSLARIAMALGKRLVVLFE